MKKILVIGGSYFAGRVFVEELRKEKDLDIHVFNRGRYRLGFEHITEHCGDREEVVQIRSAIPEEEWDAVVDFCGYNPSHIEKMLSNVPGNIKQYIFISTTTIYEKSTNLPIRENAPKLSGPQAELGLVADYGYDKWSAECTLRQACGQKGIVYTILRPAIIYGFYNYAPREQYFFDLLRERKTIVVPDGNPALFSFIWVVDMARMIIRCIENEKTYNQEFNLSSDELVSYLRIIEVLEEITGEKIDVLYKSVDEINRERIPLPFPLDEHLVSSGRKLHQLLNFDYTPFKNGLRETLEYYNMVQKNRQQ
ncbi:MAG: NAD-dependent epimerase/dehydratase family protein [Desulfuromonadaceae bacterium]